MNISNKFKFMWNEFFGAPSKVYQTLEISKYLINEVQANIDQYWYKKLIDIWTWSWSLAISIALSNKDMKILVTDNSIVALQEAEKNIKNLWCTNIENVHTNYVDNVNKNFNPDIIIASLPYWNESYLTPWNTIDHLKIYPKWSYFHESWDPFWCYIEMLNSIVSKGWKTKILIETGILTEPLISSYLSKIENINWVYKIHDESWFSTTKIEILK